MKEKVKIDNLLPVPNKPNGEPNCKQVQEERQINKLPLPNGVLQFFQQGMDGILL